MIEGIFNGHNGVELYFRVLKPKSIPKAAMILVHGHGDHSGSLENLSTRLVENDYIVYAYDQRGHGKSSGKRGFIRTWEEYKVDLDKFRRMVVSEFPHLPLFIVGHSLGGVVTLDYVLDHGTDLAGVIAIAPAISYEATRSERLLISLMGKLKPDFSIVKPGDINRLTRDPDMIDKLNSDALRHDTVTPGLGRGLMLTVERLIKEASTLKLPFLLQFGLKDEITPPDKLKQFFESVAYQNKQKFEYPAMRHRPFDDVGREQFLEDLIGWLERRIAEEHVVL
ncbi:lysophospholipase [Paenibacillus sp. BSR1-1]|uniref:alpha/beta hydrolase n=1 Tax=Paenibacillus sp. BSR1-1 TaxID=3020845 RepID=UPI0025B0B23A|nr:alpha/beta hydrolase [Paenibacillus sp. BSR1-1]MDN3018374.1 lysophospholipase [Paenibacillus sp. BSR1-1]